MSFIQINKFSELHDGKNIIFCKTDYLFDEFNYINKLNNDVILITGNSDYPITDDIVNLAPKNIKKWFAQNALSNSKILEPYPMGIENKNESIRNGHGIGYNDRVEEKEKLLSRKVSKSPTKKIYANFNVNTNFHYRNEIKNCCISSELVDWEEPNLSLQSFFDKILEYEVVVCPAGNGVDTHRLWEVLYSKRIPITFKIGNYKIYELYEKLPIVVLENCDDLKNSELLQHKIRETKEKKIMYNLINFEYWKEKIITC
jgi:hypothetical protein